MIVYCKIVLELNGDLVLSYGQVTCGNYEFLEDDGGEEEEDFDELVESATIIVDEEITFNTPPQRRSVNIFLLFRKLEYKFHF